MIVRCRACGVEEDRASPGCAEHARRSAETAHLYATASGLSCPADCPVCHGRGVVPGEQLTPALVREGIAAVVEAAAEEDFEAAHAEEDKLRARVLRAIAGGRCDDPETCARLALSTSVVAFTRHCA